MVKKITVQLLLVLFIISTFLNTAIAQSLKNKAERPNVIFILTDDLGYGDIGVFFQNKRKVQGDKSMPYHLTPSIDKLAANGVQFTDQYSNAPVCAPSRASLMTGVNQGNATVRDNQFDKQIENNHTIATVLKAAGYATSAVGKWGLQGKTREEPNWPAHPLKRGFDDYFGYMRHSDGHEHYPYEGIYRGKKQVWHNNENLAADMAKCYTTDLWTAYAKKWIVDHEKGKDAKKPFFMFLAYDSPHAVLELPAQAYPAGGGLKGGLQWIGTPGKMINTASGTVDSYIYPEYAKATYDDDKDPKTPETAWPDTYKRYASAVRRIDDGVGDIMQLLQDMHIADNTIVVFTSDNGPSIESYLPAGFVPNSPEFFSSFGPFDGIKRDVWEGGVRMPTIASWPAQALKGKVVSAPSMLSDWLPTFADAAHIHAPAKADGVSLLPSLTGKGTQAKGLIYSEYYEGGKTPNFKGFEESKRGRKRDQMQMIRMGDLVGVRYQITSAADDFEIYDVVKDPKETNNLALLPAYKSMQEAMKNKVLQVRRADKGAPRPYDNALVPAAAVAGQTSAGLTWKFFKGNFPWVISEAGLTADKNGTGGLGELKSVPAAGMTLYEGFIKIPADGEYSFALQATGKAYVRIHEAELIDADFGYQSGSEETGKVNLKAGFHPVKIYYLKETSKPPMISFKMKGAGAGIQSLKVIEFYHIR